MDKILTLFGAQPTTPLKCGSAGGKWTIIEDHINGGKCEFAKEDIKSVFGDNGIVTNIINWILYIVGVVAVVMIIVGGIRYASSAGNEKSVTGAKNTIIYALIGLAAAVLAWVIVNFVLDVLG